VKFAQLLIGMDARVENYADRLPRSSTNSFLLFAKGACKAPRSFSAIADLIPAQLSEIKNYDIGKWKLPQSIEVPADVGTQRGHWCTIAAK